MQIGTVEKSLANKIAKINIATIEDIRNMLSDDEYITKKG